MKPGDRVFNTKTGLTGIIVEREKYGFLVNYSDKSGVMFRRSHPSSLVLLPPEDDETKT